MPPMSFGLFSRALICSEGTEGQQADIWYEKKMSDFDWKQRKIS